MLVQRFEGYAKWRNSDFAEELGDGIHGVVRVVEANVNFRRFAVKIHRYADAYFRERSIDQRLAEKKVVTILGL